MMMGVKPFSSTGKEVSRIQFPAIFSAVQNSLNKDTSSLYLKIRKAIIGDYSQQENQQIKDLMQYWSDQAMKLEDILNTDEFLSEQSINYYLSIDCLAARVYLKITDYFVRVRSYNDLTEEQAKEFEDFRDLMNKEELVFSYDRFFWGRRTVKNKFYSEQNEKERISVIKKSLKKVFECVQNCSNTTMKKVYSFMSKLQLINLQENVEVTNRLILRLQRISKEDQKIHFLHSLQANYLQGLQNLQKENLKYDQQQDQTLKSISKKLPNYQFYNQQTQKNINHLHAKIGDYQYLQQRHDYIQWMFPNHYGSAFNSKSSPLSYLEKRLFINDQVIGFRLLKSIYIFLDFMGIRLDLKDLSLNIISFPRLKAVILVNFHNHLRIMRILACLSVIGFRKIALNLIKFLDDQTSQKGFLSKEREQFERSWAIYGDESPGVATKKAKQMCFHEDDQFPSDHSILQLLHNFTLKQENKQVIKQPQLQQNMITEDLQAFNPPRNKEEEVKQTHQPNPIILEEQQDKGIQLNEFNKTEFNITSVPQDQKIEQNANQDESPEISESKKYLPAIKGTQIAAVNITAKSSE